MLCCAEASLSLCLSGRPYMPFVLDLGAEHSLSCFPSEDTGLTNLRWRATIRSAHAALGQTRTGCKAKPSYENTVTTHSTPTLQNALTIAVPLHLKAPNSIRQSQWHERAYRYIILVTLLIQKSSDSWAIWCDHIINKGRQGRRQRGKSSPVVHLFL